jgi:endo-1,4-beta-xylanase
MNSPLVPVSAATDSGCSGVTLFEAALNLKVLFGAAVAADDLSDESYRLAIARHFSMIEPENALKWAALRPAREVFDFAAADAIVEFARANRQRVRGHVLAWHAYNPGWLRRGVFSPTQLRSLLKEHVETVLGHYAVDIFAWDVVNEALADGPAAGLGSSFCYNRPGIGFAEEGARYIDEIFRWARAANPSAQLFYNDDPCATPSRAHAMIRLVTDLLERGTPIDGIGLQLHLDLSSDISSLEESLERLSGTGLQVHVTELDVALPRNAGQPLDAEHLHLQAEIYRRVIALCAQRPCCTAIQTWGVDDGHSWIPTFTRGALGGALLLDESYAPKPAYVATVEALTEAAAIRWREGKLP